MKLKGLIKMGKKSQLPHFTNYKFIHGVKLMMSPLSNLVDNLD